MTKGRVPFWAGLDFEAALCIILVWIVYLLLFVYTDFWERMGDLG